MAIPQIVPYSLDEALAPCETKVDWCINPKKAVLLIHDMQAYFANYYDCEQEPFVTVVNNMQAVISGARGACIPVVYTAQPSNQEPQDRALLTDFWGKGLQDNHQSHHILAAVAPCATETVYCKWRYSAFQKTTFDDDLRAQGKSQIIICGIYAHIGILSTALEGFMRDYQCFVVDDAVADFSAEEHFWARKWIAGRCGKLLNTASVVKQMTYTAVDIDVLVSETLEIPISDIHESDNLADWGLDSVRLMTIADKLNASGKAIDFIMLAEKPTLKEWRELMAN